MCTLHVVHRKGKIIFLICLFQKHLQMIRISLTKKRLGRLGWMAYYGIWPSLRKRQFAAMCAICFLWKLLSRDQVNGHFWFLTSHHKLVPPIRRDNWTMNHQRLQSLLIKWRKSWQVGGYWGLLLSAAKPIITRSLFLHLTLKFHPPSFKLTHSIYQYISIDILKINRYFLGMHTSNFGLPTILLSINAYLQGVPKNGA